VAVVGKLVQIGKRQLYTKGETINKTIQRHRIHIMESNRIKQKTNKKDITRHKSSNYKKTNRNN
jgi:hypothetical protein